MSNILFEFNVDAPIEKAYQALTEKAGVQGWWTNDTRIEASEGAEAYFGFGQGHFLFTITKLKANERIEWETVEGMPDWGGTKVVFTLKPAEEGGGTSIHFAHRNFASEEGTFAMVAYNWAFFLFSLKAYLETGTGTPVSV